MAAYEVTVLRDGYSYSDTGNYKANGTITLIKGPVNIVVDTGSPCQSDKDIILTGLTTHHLTVSDIDYVIATHGHVDHVGNLNIFPSNCTFIVGHDIYKDCYYTDNDLGKGGCYQLNDEVYVMSTAGHTCCDVSVVVKNTSEGVVVIAGDLFECEDDLRNSDLWQANSFNVSLQESNRAKVLQLADVIVPGHGPKFNVVKLGDKTGQS